MQLHVGSTRHFLIRLLLKAILIDIRRLFAFCFIMAAAQRNIQLIVLQVVFISLPVMPWSAVRFAESVGCKLYPF